MHHLLHQTPVLVVDCQTTGARPGQSHLLEIGWLRCCAADPASTLTSRINTCLVKLPGDARMPGRVARLTGITAADMQTAREPATVCRALWDAAAQTAGESGLPACPTVIHYVRFEKAFLRHMHRQWAPAKPFAFRWICTHAMAGRLLPHLPRRGLRAVAGYLGHSIPEEKRCAHHVQATAIVWQRLIDMLQNEHGIRTLQDLHAWLADIPPPRAVRCYPLDRAKRRRLPERPGVYRMLRSNGDVLYVGKAKSIAHRVASYFQQSRKHSEHILEMLSQALDINHTETASELEAALLESDEIKRLDPPYNIALRSGDRRLCYLSPDMERLSDTPDTDYPIGPLPFQANICVLPLLIRAVADRTVKPLWDAAFLERVFSLSTISAPGADCLENGWLAFWQRYEACLSAHRPAAALRRIGRQLWRRRSSASKAGQGEDGGGQEKVPENTVWTPDDIADLLEGVVLQGTHSIRRSRWLCRLSESAVIWTRGQADGAGVDQRCLWLNGQQMQAMDPHIGLSVADLFSTDWYKARSARRKWIDIAVYDRLRIVTTELRRLLSQGRKIEVWLRPAVRLTNLELARLLQWI